MRVARAIQNLTEAFERLPGIGPKSAQRLTYYLLHVPQVQLDQFAEALKRLRENTKECAICHNIAETNPCDLCMDSSRDKSVVCVVEQPLDVLAVERGRYSGQYHVLHGVIDPLHNIGPDEIRIFSLLHKIEKADTQISEVVLALDPNMEGEATCLFIKREIEKLGKNIRVTRLGMGLAMGADIEYADDMTLLRALEGRRDY